MLGTCKLAARKSSKPWEEDTSFLGNTVGLMPRELVLAGKVGAIMATLAAIKSCMVLVSGAGTKEAKVSG